MDIKEETSAGISEETKNDRKLSDDILNHFTNITKGNEKARIKSSTHILRHLIENKNDNGGYEQKYTLVRLIRGLGSSKADVRASYYTLLVTFLHLKASLDVNEILKLISDQLHTSGSYTKSENADVCTGQILACGSIIRSPLWKKCSFSTRKEIFERILKTCKERTYLPLIAYTFILAGFENVDAKTKKQLTPLVEAEIPLEKSEVTLDTLCLMHFLSGFPGVSKSFISQRLGVDKIFCTENVEYLTNMLVNVQKLSECTHPLFSIASEYFTKPEMWHEFDRNVGIPIRNKQLIIVRLFTNILKKVDPQDVPHMITENMVQLLLDRGPTNFKGQNMDKEFQESVSKFYDALEAALNRDNCEWETRLSVLKKLLFHKDAFVYDKINGCRIIFRLIVPLNLEGIKKLSKSLRNVIKRSERTYYNTGKLAAAHLLIKLVNHVSTKEEVEWKTEQLRLLMNLALFKHENDDIGIELAESLKKAFFGALDLKMTNIEQLNKILSGLIQEVDSQISSENLDSVLRVAITPEHYEIWQRTVDQTNKLEQKIKKKNSVKMVFFTLFLHMGLQIFNEPKLAADSLNELFECYAKAKKNKKAEENQVSEDTNDLAWIDVVIELFLSWLSRTSHSLRRLVNTTLPYMTKYITVSTMHQILSVLDPNNKDIILSKSSNPEDDNSDSESEEDNEDDDPKEPVENGNTEEDAEDGDSDSEMNDEDMEKEGINDKLRMALHQVLNSKAESDAESIDLDEMSDTEAEKLDHALSDVFRQFKPNLGNRRKQAKDEEMLMHFRIRAMDLVEIYLDSTPYLAVVLEMILPLVQAVEYCIREKHHKPLLDRLERCLKKLPKLKGFPDADEVDAEVLTDILQKLLDDETKTNIIKNYMSKHVCDCTLFIIKQTETMKVPKAFKKILIQELKKCFVNKDNPTAMMLFKQLLQRNWNGLKYLIPHILQAICSQEVKVFKKNQAVVLAETFYKNRRYLSDDLEKKKAHLSKTHLEFSEGVVQLIRDADEKYLSFNFMNNLLSLLKDMKKCPLGINEIDFKGTAENFKEMYGRLNVNARFAQTLKQYCQLMDVDDKDIKIKAKKRKNGDMGQQSEVGEVKSKKKKKHFKSS